MSTKENLHKPNEIIGIKKPLSNMQRKAYNVILYQAWHEVRLNREQRDFLINMTQLKEKAGIKATDNKQLKKCIEALMGVFIEFVQTPNEDDDWNFFPLLTKVKKSKNQLIVRLDEDITQALCENDFYTTLDLLTIRKLQGKHSATIYELAMRYHKAHIPVMTVTELREYTGTETKKSYDDFGMLRQRVIEPAIKEINEMTDIVLSYEAITAGTKKVEKVKFNLEHKHENTDFVTYDEFELLAQFKAKTGRAFPHKKLTKFIDEIGVERIARVFANIEKFSFPADNPVAFFTAALRDGYEIPSCKKPVRNQKQKAPQTQNHIQRDLTTFDFDGLYENANFTDDDSTCGGESQGS